jgi:hypothetical protein
MQIAQSGEVAGCRGLAVQGLAVPTHDLDLFSLYSRWNTPARAQCGLCSNDSVPRRSKDAGAASGKGHPVVWAPLCACWRFLDGSR